MFIWLFNTIAAVSVEIVKTYIVDTFKTTMINLAIYCMRASF